MPGRAVDPFLVLGEARDGAVLEDGLLGRPGAGQLLGLAAATPRALLVTCVAALVSKSGSQSRLSTLNCGGFASMRRCADSRGSRLLMNPLNVEAATEMRARARCRA